MEWEYIGVQRAELAIKEAMMFATLPEAITFLNHKIATFQILDPAIYTIAIACLLLKVAELERIRLRAILA